MKKHLSKILIFLSAFILIYLFFYIIYLKVGNDDIFPTPIDTIINFFKLLGSSKTYLLISYSFLRLIISILISFIIGASLGMLAGYFKSFALFMKPIITIFRSLPIVCLIVVLMIILGFDFSPSIIVSIMLIPLIYQAFYEGINSFDIELMSVWKIESNFNFGVLKKIILPMILPFAKVSFIQSVGLGFKVLVMAEFILNTPNSIGNIIKYNADYLNYIDVFSWSIIMIILVIFLEYIPKIIALLRENLKRNVKKNEKNFIDDFSITNDKS